MSRAKMPFGRFYLRRKARRMPTFSFSHKVDVANTVCFAAQTAQNRNKSSYFVEEWCEKAA